MTLLDLIVGFYMPQIYGWLFLLSVILIEASLLSMFLASKGYVKKVWFVVTASNLVTTLIGYLVFDHEHNGGYLINWLPVYNDHGSLDFYSLKVILIVSFIATLFIETIYNSLALREKYSAPRIVWGTLLINLITYCLGILLFKFYYELHDLYDQSSWIMK